MMIDLRLKGGVHWLPQLKVKDFLGDVEDISNFSNFVRFEKCPSDIVPFQAVCPKSITTNSESCSILYGMVPFIALANNFKLCKDDKSLIDSGIEPQNIFFLSTRDLKFVRFPSASGKWPLNLLCVKAKISKLLFFDKLSTNSIRLPLRLLNANVSVCKFERLPKIPGIVPSKN